MALPLLLPSSSKHSLSENLADALAFLKGKILNLLRCQAFQSVVVWIGAGRNLECIRIQVLHPQVKPEHGVCELTLQTSIDAAREADGGLYVVDRVPVQRFQGITVGVFEEIGCGVEVFPPQRSYRVIDFLCHGRSVETGTNIEQHLEARIGAVNESQGYHHCRSKEKLLFRVVVVPLQFW